jgi:soluble lytic murein transglycosylase
MREKTSKNPSSLAIRISRAAVVVFVFGSVFAAHAGLESVTITSEDKFPAPRWMYGGSEKAPAGSSTVTALSQVKSAQLEGKYDECLKKVAAVRTQVKSLQAWLATAEIDCAVKNKPSAANAERLSQALSRVNQNPSWLLRGPQAQNLRAGVIEGSLNLIEQDSKTNRSRAWKTIESVQDFLVHMDKQQKARLWRMAGDIAFLQQNADAAGDYMKRSLVELESAEVRSKLASIESTLGTQKESPPVAPKPSDAPAPAQEASIDELQIVDRVTAALKTGDLISAVEDAMKIISNYPGSARSKWASDRVLDVYLSLIDKTDAKYTLLRERLLKLMEKGDADRLADWSRSMFGRGQYGDSFVMAKRALDKLSGTKRTGVLDLAAKAAMGADQFSDAKSYSQELVEQNSGTKEAREAMFRLGLISFRAGEYTQALAQLEKVAGLPQSENLELSARYWLWRSLQKLNSEKAASAADDLMKRFPFSYYGLRARIEVASNTLEWKAESRKVESKLWLTSNERMGWERAQLLLRAGWLEEAQAEIRILPPPLQADDKAVRALLWAASGQYLTASKLVNEAWDEKGELRGMPFVAAAFPPEFDAWIAEQAKARGLDRYLVKSLIKQESGFNTRAVSSSNAIGLMQIIPPTAREIANDLKAGPLEIPTDLFQPKKNIQFGTFYISRLLSKYQGHVPLALAAYNAGPGRMDRWLRARASLKGLAAQKSSAPEDEIWFDEIPYAETSFYVKAILRNLLIYRMLANDRVQGPMKVSNPIWSFQ